MFILLQLNHNVKQVSWYQMRGPNRVTLTLKDSSVVMMDKLSLLVAKKIKEYLETVRLGKPAGMFLLTCVLVFTSLSIHFQVMLNFVLPFWSFFSFKDKPGEC